MIIFRYLTREILLALSAICGVMLPTFLGNQFVRYLNRAASGKFASELLIRMTLLEIPHLLSLLLPLGLFVGILLAYGRLYADNEMTVMNVGGLSPARLTKYTMPVTGAIIIITSVLAFWLNPILITERNTLLSQSGTTLQLQSLLPGRFNSLPGGERIFYVEKISVDRLYMHGIFAAQLVKNKDAPEGTAWIISTAENGYQTINLNNGDHFFIITHGQTYKGTPGQNDFQLVQFDKAGIRIESNASPRKNPIEASSTSALWHNTTDRANALGELQWRISIPVSILILSLLAVPLSKIQPRQGRYAKLLPAVLIYLVYADLLVISRNWVQQGTISPALGVWWVHGLLILITSIFWMNEIGWIRIKLYLKRFL